MASLLIEIKSQQVLPRGDEIQEEIEDPRQELVRRLLEYKKYRDAASILEERSRDWQQHYPRLSVDLPRHDRDLAGEPIQELELWDLVSAFGRIMRETEAARPSSIVYDDTPIHVHMRRIHAELLEQRPHLFPRFVRREHAQVEVGRHLSRHSGACPALPRSRRAERLVRRDLGLGRSELQDAIGFLERR